MFILNPSYRSAFKVIFMSSQQMSQTNYENESMYKIKFKIINFNKQYKPMFLQACFWRIVFLLNYKIFFIDILFSKIFLTICLPNQGRSPKMDRGPTMDFIFKSHTFLRHISMHAIDNCLKLKLSRISSSTLSLQISMQFSFSIEGNTPRKSIHVMWAQRKQDHEESADIHISLGDG